MITTRLPSFFGTYYDPPVGGTAGGGGGSPALVVRPNRVADC